MLGVSVREHRGGQHIALRRARGQSCGWPYALHIEDNAGNFCVIAKARKLRHQRNAGSRGRSHGPRSGPARAEHHAYGGQFVFRLHDSKRCFAVRADTEALHVINQLLNQGRRRRDRIPGDNADPGKHASQRRCRVAVNDDLALGLVRRLNVIRIEFRQRSCRVVKSCFHRVQVQVSSLLLLLELLADGLFHFLHVQSKQLGGHPHIDHVLDQLAQLGFRTNRRHQLVIGNGIEGQVVAELVELQRIIEEHRGAGSQRQNIFPRRLWIHSDEKVDLFFAGDVAALVGADGIPRRQSGNIGRKKVLAGNRNAHLEDGTQQH